MADIVNATHPVSLLSTAAPYNVQPSFSLFGLGAASLLFCFYLSSFLWQRSRSSKLPTVNPVSLYDILCLKAKFRFITGSLNLIRKGFTEFGKEASFRMQADSRELFLLSNKYTNELKNDPRLDFIKLYVQDYHSGIPGFEFSHHDARDSLILKDIANKQLTTDLHKTTDALSEETEFALPLAFSHATEYHDLNLRQALLPLMARVSSRAFHGEALCRNEEWVSLSASYSGNVHRAALELRVWPWWLKPLAQYFIKSCNDVRREVRRSRQFLEPMIAERARAKAADSSLRFDDMIEYAELAAAGRPFDPVVVSLLFNMAAMPPMTDLLTQAMLDLAMFGQDLFDPLREEIRGVLQSDGGKWKRSSFYRMRLLDSVLKECQRLKPSTIVPLRGLVTEDIKLSDGLVLPKGTYAGVSTHIHWDPDVYPDPNRWDGRRFWRMREAGGAEHKAQMTSSHPEHMGFSIGRHICPGRFFAVHEVKVVLCHILLNYDWKIKDGCTPQIRNFAWSLGADSSAWISIRKRKDSVL